MPTPCAGSRWPGAARGPHVPTPSSAPVRRWWGRCVGRDPARPAAPSAAATRACSPPCRRSRRSLPTATRARPGAPAPSAPPAHAARGSTVLMSSSWLHPLKGWSLRRTRGGSELPDVNAAALQFNELLTNVAHPLNATLLDRRLHDVLEQLSTRTPDHWNCRYSSFSQGMGGVAFAWLRWLQFVRSHDVS